MDGSEDKAAQSAQAAQAAQGVQIDQIDQAADLDSAGSQADLKAAKGDEPLAYEADFDPLFRSLAHVALQIDEQSRIVAIHGAAARLGLADFKIGVDFTELLHPRDLPLWRAILLRLIDRSVVGPVPMRLESHDINSVEPEEVAVDLVARRHLERGRMMIQIALNPYHGAVAGRLSGRVSQGGRTDDIRFEDFEALAAKLVKLDPSGGASSLKALSNIMSYAEAPKVGLDPVGTTQQFLTSLYKFLSETASEERSARAVKERREKRIALEAEKEGGASDQAPTESAAPPPRPPARHKRVDAADPKALKAMMRKNVSYHEKGPNHMFVSGRDGLSESDEVKAAIYALEQAKKPGRTNTMEALTADYEEQVERAKNQIRAFKQVVLQERFEVALQPIVDLVTKTTHHFEGLVRFDKSVYSGSPYEFICFAEDIGVIHEFDLAMTMKMVSTIKRCRRIGFDLHGAVNLSGRSVQSPVFLRNFFALLEDISDLRTALSFELTESSQIEDLDATNRVLSRIRDFGHKVALDDFGAGASGLQYLRNLDVDMVKIDGVYVRQALENDDDKNFLKSIVELCATRRIDIVGECVETEADRDFLVDLGVQWGQGWYFGKPMPIDEALRVFADSKKKTY